MELATTTSHDADALMDTTLKHGAVLITGPHGIGKSHALRAVASMAKTRGLTAVSVVGSPAARTVPLSCFTGAMPDYDGPLDPGAIITSLTRRRSRVLLFVDAVDLLDETSQLVVGHLARTAGIKTVMAARSLEDCPAEIRALYDGGQLVEVPLQPLPDDTLIDALHGWLDGPVTPGTLREILQAAGGNPLIARELVAGSLSAGALRDTAHGWELDGPVTATAQLLRVIGAQLGMLSDEAVDAMALLALAGSLPESAFAHSTQRSLTRSGLVTREVNGWLHANQPLLAAAVRAQMSQGHWQALAQEACRLLDEAARAYPGHATELTRLASAIALENDLPLAHHRATSLATYALTRGDYPLALRAADAALESALDPAHPVVNASEPWRVRGLAASSMGMVTSAYESLERAQAAACDDAEVAAAALALASHIGLTERDPHGALEAIGQARAKIEDEDWQGHLDRAAFRWAAVAGQGDVTAQAPEEVTDAEAAMGLAIMATSAVVTGPLDQAFALEANFRALPPEVVGQAPGAAALMQLASIMALSYTGDIQATRRALDAQIELARRDAPEMSGTWEYALGVVELFAADAGRAHRLASAAVDHLRWRDPFGLEPAAVALQGAAAAGANLELEAVHATATGAASQAPDPKAAVLAVWTSAWSAAAERRPAQAARVLLDGADAMLVAQHTFFAAKLAHCAVRVNGASERAVSVLERADAIGGGGLVSLMLEHARATIDGDATQLDLLAQDMVEMGMVATATDTWFSLAQHARKLGASDTDSRRWMARVSAIRLDHPEMALWHPGATTTSLLTRREYEVASLVAQRLTTKEIAGVRGVSPHTVNNQLQAVFTKLGVSGRSELREIWDDAMLDSAAPPPFAPPL